MKKKKISIKQMVSELNQRSYHKIFFQEGKYYETRFSWKENGNITEEVTPRDIIKMYRWVNRQVHGKKSLKYFDHRINRHKTRDIINKGCFEDIPQNKPYYKENPWNWD
jgi:hypothetical protein